MLGVRSYFILLLSGVGLCVFCFLLFFSNNLGMFWLFLELATLCVIPGFFLCSSESMLLGLFSYIIVSSVSSSLILCGLLEERMMFFLIFGLLIKFGLFPFFGWIYVVGLNSNWFVLWSLSTFLKVPIFFFPFFLSSGGFLLVSVLSCLTFIVLSFMFWFYSYSWFHCWCHMMLSSSSVLVVVSLVVSMDVLFYLFVVYFFWATCVLLFFWFNGSSDDMLLGGLGYYYFFCFFLVSMPVSFSIFYKLFMASSVFSCGLVVLGSWVVYSVSEQFYLLKYAMSCELPKSSFGVMSVV